MKEKDQKNRRKENLQKVCRRRYNLYFWFSYFHPSLYKEKEMMLPTTSKILVQIVKKNSSSLFPNSLLHHIPSLFVSSGSLQQLGSSSYLNITLGNPCLPMMNTHLYLGSLTIFFSIFMTRWILVWEIWLLII